MRKRIAPRRFVCTRRNVQSGHPARELPAGFTHADSVAADTGIVARVQSECLPLLEAEMRGIDVKIGPERIDGYYFPNLTDEWRIHYWSCLMTEAAAVARSRLWIVPDCIRCGRRCNTGTIDRLAAFADRLEPARRSCRRIMRDDVEFIEIKATGRANFFLPAHNRDLHRWGRERENARIRHALSVGVCAVVEERWPIAGRLRRRFMGAPSTVTGTTVPSAHEKSGIVPTASLQALA